MQGGNSSITIFMGYTKVYIMSEAESSTKKFFKVLLFFFFSSDRSNKATTLPKNYPGRCIKEFKN